MSRGLTVCVGCGPEEIGELPGVELTLCEACANAAAVFLRREIAREFESEFFGLQVHGLNGPNGLERMAQ